MIIDEKSRDYRVLKNMIGEMSLHHEPRFQRAAREMKAALDKCEARGRQQRVEGGFSPVQEVTDSMLADDLATRQGL